MRAARVLSVLFFVICLGTVFIFAADTRSLTGEGRGRTEKEARDEAMADLSSQISVEIKSVLTHTTRQQTSNHAKEIVDVDAARSVIATSELPIIGAEFVTSKLKNEYRVWATLHAETSLALYRERITADVRQMDDLLSRIEKESLRARKLAIYGTILGVSRDIEKLSLVARSLGAVDIASLRITTSEASRKIQELEEAADTLDMAAGLIMRDAEYGTMYVFAPTARDSQEITPFASSLRDRLNAVAGKRSADVAVAEIFVRGVYDISPAGIDIITYFTTRSGGTAGARSIHILPIAYHDFSAIPKTVSFEKLIRAGLAVGSDLRVELKTINGSDNLIYRHGQEVELFTKLNRPGYIVFGSHVLKDTEKQSYLLELYPDAEGGRKFIRFVNGDDVNKWLSIGKFEVTSPYGVETLHALASTDDPVGRIPALTFDKSSGLYVVSRNPEEGVAKTRGLRPKRENKALSAEALLMLTTME